MQSPLADREEDVRRLEVAVRDAPSMSLRHRVADRPHDVSSLRGGERPGAPEPVREILPLEQLHHEVALPGVLADVGDVNDVRVAKAGRQLRFLQESSAGGRRRRERRAENLDSETFPGLPLYALVDGAHRSDANEAFDHVFAEYCSSIERGLPLLFHLSPSSVFGRHFK